MGRPKRDPNRVATRERILGTAEAAFSAAGFNSVSLDDIARVVGLTRPSIFYHFESKAELYRQVLLLNLDALSEALLPQAKAPGDAAEQIDDILQSFLAFLDERPTFASLLLRDLMDGRGPSREHVKTVIVPLLDRLEERVEEHGSDSLRSGVPLRAALLQVAATALIYAASPSFREDLWANGSRSFELARLLILAEPDAAAKS